MTSRRAVRFIVPDGVDDPRRVSGGNVYDRHVRDGLRARGWAVETVEAADGSAAASTLRHADGDTLVLIDGLVGGWAPAELESASRRATVVVLAHMVVAAFPDAPDASIEAEQRMLACARRVVVTSRWSAGELARRVLVDPARIVVAPPGASAVGTVPSVAEPLDTAASPPTREPPVDAPRAATPPGNLLCVGVVARHKGQDTLLAALARVPERGWTCEIVGSTESFPEFARVVELDAQAFDGRVKLTGVLDGAILDETYRRTALLVAPSRVESAGMAIVDARARGIPVIGADVGGIRDALAGGGGLLVRPDDPGALACALQAWMTDPELRTRLRAEALAARPALPTWDDAVTTIADALEAA